MNDQFAAAMRQAVRSLRVQKVAEATRLIQSALLGKLSDESSSSANRATPIARLSLPKSVRERGKDTPEPEASSDPDSKHEISHRTRRPLREALRALRKGRLDLETSYSLPKARSLKSARPAIPDGAEFLTRSYTCAAGARDYKLYIPAAVRDRPRGLVVMLHGCKQNPDDFAAGTNMNALAESHGLLIAYPTQKVSANSASCWNWFNPADQVRDKGEPSIIAGITRQLIQEFDIDPRRVFVAGLSAGGAMAAVMGETYPDLFAAIAVHSGIACRSANDVISAFAAMRGETISGAPTKARSSQPNSKVRTIVFHGSADRTVAPSNADRIVADATGRIASAQIRRIEGSDNGRRFARSYVLGEDDVPAVECWLIDGTGHAWSGGPPKDRSPIPVDLTLP